jgi:hypothetical protein
LIEEAPCARHGNAVSPTSCAICRARCRRINGRSSRRAPLPATTPPRRRSPVCCGTTLRSPTAPPCPSGLTCLQDDFEACIAHCARYCTLKLVCPARLGLDHEGHRVCTPVGVSSIRASTIRAMAIMTNAVETNRILGSSLKVIYCTSFSHELY